MPGRRVPAPPPVSAHEEEEADEDEEILPDESQLQFSQALSWPAGRAIPTAELLKRLQALATELKDADQEIISNESLIKPAGELAHSNILRHKDNGVRSWAAHCLVDILRLAAPDAPFSAQQLKDVFTLFVTHSISSLSDSANAYNNQHYYVLKTLLSTQAIVLVTDLPSSNKLLLTIFATCFDILARTKDAVTKNVEYQLTGLLSCLVDECEALPAEAIEILLAQFLRADTRVLSSAPVKGKKSGQTADKQFQQAVLISKQLPPAYGVAQSVCNTCENRMSNYISQYFSGVILDASSFASAKPKSRHRPRDESDGEDNDEARGPSKDDLDQLQRAHSLLRELWKACPTVLHNVIPQIETELSADNTDLRRLATEAFGDMAAGIGVDATMEPPTLDPMVYPPVLDSTTLESQVDGQPRAAKASQSFAHTHVAAYNSFIGRKNDKSSEVRAAWTIGAGRILRTSAGGLGLSPIEQQELVRDLSQMLVDADDKVRAAAVQALANLSVHDFIAKIGPAERSNQDGDSLIHHLSERMKEVNPAVRSSAGHLMGKLWGVTIQGIARDNEVVSELFGTIPSYILNAAYTNKPEISALINNVLFESLVPLGYPSSRRKAKQAQQHGHINGEGRELSDDEADNIRAERILMLYAALDERAKKVLLPIMARPAELSRKVVKPLLATCEAYNGGVMDKDEKQTKAQLNKLVDYLAQLTANPTQTRDDLWKFAKHHDRRSYILMRFCMADESDYRKVHKSIKELLKRFNDFPGVSSTFSSSILNILYLTSNLFFNKSHLRPIIEMSSRKGDPLAPAAQELLKEISQRAPGIFKAHGQELCHYVQASAPSAKRTNESGALDALKACASFARRYPSDVPKEKTFIDAMKQYVLYGAGPKEAKYATSIILLSTNRRELHTKELFRLCVADFSYDSNNYVLKLAALSQLMLLNAQEMDQEAEIDEVVRIALEVVKRLPSSDLANEPDSPAAVKEQEASCWALKILVNRLRAYPTAESIRECATPIFTLLSKSLYDPISDPNSPSLTPHERALFSQRRLQAALLHIKLASHVDFDTFIDARTFGYLVYVAQDQSQPVRHTFIAKLMKTLSRDRLPSRFYTLVFLLAFEPSKTFKQEASIWLRARATTLHNLKRTSLEICFSRFLSMLAHHPDISDDPDPADLPDLVQYFLFYLSSVATVDNLSLIYHVTQRIKGVRDAYPRTDEDARKEMSKNLYYLADVALATINAYASAHNWTIQAYSGSKASLPSGIFALVNNHREAQAIAETQHLASEAADQVEALVRRSLRKGQSNKKRASDGEIEGHTAKRRDTGGAGKESANRVNGVTTSKTKASAKAKATPRRVASKTSRKTREIHEDGSDEASDAEHPQDAERPLPPESATRRASSRAKGRKSYADTRDQDDEDEMETWQEEGTSMSSEKENRVAV